MNKNILWVVVVIIVAIISFLLGRTAVQEPSVIETPKVEQAVQKSYAGAEKHEVTADEAKAYIERYQKKMMPQGKEPEGWKGGTFDRAIIDKILDQPGCVQLRFYYGLDEAGKQTLVVVGVDSAGKDIIGVYGEKIFNCPPICF